MADTHYRLIGEPKIPEDKREEVNQAVLRILHYCGIRKENKVQAGTGEFTVVEKPVPDADGMITFDYSIYENRMYEPCTYDTKTCAINVKKCGLSEYGLVINMLYTLLESYGNGSCYFVADRHLSTVSAYMAMTSTVLGKKLINTARGNVFDVIHFTADHPDCDMVSSDQLLDDDIFDYTDVDQVQLCQSIISEIQSDSKAKKKKICIEKSRIRQARIELRTNYMYQTLHELYQKNKEELWQYLKVLLDADLNTRKKMAEDESAYGILAELSLYLYPAHFICEFAEITHQQFWDCWNRTGIHGYSDCMNDHDSITRCDKTHYIHIPFSKAICRKNEDECLEYWDGDENVLSDDMIACIDSWKQIFETTEDIPDMNVESRLSELLRSYNSHFFRVPLEKTFVDRIKENADDERWRRLLLTVCKVLFAGADQFLELDSYLVFCLLDEYRDDTITDHTHALTSLICNDEQRTAIFGF